MIAGSPSRSQAAPGPWLRCPPVEEQLARVEAGLLEAVGHHGPHVEEVCGHLVRAGGKRLRPALTLLAATYGRTPGPAILDVAVATELLHLATLYHDDVVDEATVRRGSPSANARWCNQVAAFAGAYLFSRAMELFASGGDGVNRTVSAAVSGLWSGQMREIEGVRSLDVDDAHLFSVIEQKTATLFELPCRLGALVSRAPAPHRTALARYGRALGVAFQLVDDVMDIAADEAALGKRPGTDLREGIYTLPVLYTLAAEGRGGQRLRAILTRRVVGENEIQEALAMLRANGSLSHTLETAGRFAGQASRSALRLPEGDARDSLIRLADRVVRRGREL